MRMFSEHKKRETLSLDGVWTAQTLPGGHGQREGAKEGKHTVLVPSVWNTEVGMLEYEGKVSYERSFTTSGGCLKFDFGAVMTQASVYFDGELLGEHYGGFCKFSFTKYGVLPGEHTLTVVADNTFDINSIPQKLVDWFPYGGITRSVSVSRLSGICPIYSFLDYKLSEDSAECLVRLELRNAESEPVSDTVTVRIDGNEVARLDVRLDGGEYAERVVEFKLDGVKLWSPDSPTLYGLTVESSTDDLCDRVGFRWVEASEGAVLLNGKPIRFLGVNRHEEHTDFGMAFPPALMARELDLLCGMGGNFIRGSHYPNNPVFVDMMDERGIMFWSEIPMWGNGYNAERVRDPLFLERAMNMYREMLREYYNHPSILIFGMFNEIDTTAPEVREFATRVYSYMKKRCGNRLITYASNKYNKDICFDVCDVICLNAYVGWYESSNPGLASWDSMMKMMDEHYAALGVDGKPKIMSEFGAAALYGYHTFDNLKWTEEYQAELLTDAINRFLSHPGYVGTLIWHFADARTSQAMGLGRARGYNNKGILNEYRRPKMAYNAVREVYSKYNK